VTSVNDRLRNRWVIFGAVGAFAAVIAVVLIVVSIVGSSDSKTAATTTSAPSTTVERTGGSIVPAQAASAKLPGAAATVALFKGIPQQLNVLGKPGAPVTMVEFADLQCPYCGAYTTEALPALVDQYVRTGKAKFVFSGMHFIGPDSEKALRAVYAAGLQSRLWQYLHLLYGRQGAENAGWVTDDLLRSAGASIPGFDVEKMLADMNSPAVTNALAAADQQAQNASVDQTPTFFAGKTGATLEHVNVTALTPEGFQPTLDALTS
jgi:protein-disulfide isomerase